MAFISLHDGYEWNSDLELKARLHVSHRVSPMATPQEFRVLAHIPKEKTTSNAAGLESALFGDRRGRRLDIGYLNQFGTMTTIEKLTAIFRIVFDNDEIDLRPEMTANVSMAGILCPMST